MTAENFVFWLNGLLEISDPKSLNEKQIKIIKDHIALVLEKKTPDYTEVMPEIKWPAKPFEWPTSPFPYTPTDDNIWKKRTPFSPYEIWCNSLPEASC